MAIRNKPVPAIRAALPGVSAERLLVFSVEVIFVWFQDYSLQDNKTV
jgi:hypothetical protein